MVLGYQFLGDRLLLDAAANFIGNEIGDNLVCGVICQHIAKIAPPHTEATRGILLLQESIAFLFRHFEGAARIDSVDKAGGRLTTMFEQVIIIDANFRHLLLRDRVIVKLDTPVRPALENGQVFSEFSDLLDGLDATGTHADHTDALAVKVNSLFRPQSGMCRDTLKILDPFEPRHRGC